MTQAAIEIEALCHLSIQELLIKLQPEPTRGPEPGIHCVIIAAKVAESANGIECESAGNGSVAQ
ncbi:MAG: hypothetical protein ABI981_06720 [Betaproteobacteria bacterium]